MVVKDEKCMHITSSKGTRNIYKFCTENTSNCWSESKRVAVTMPSIKLVLIHTANCAQVLIFESQFAKCTCGNRWEHSQTSFSAILCTEFLNYIWSMMEMAWEISLYKLNVILSLFIANKLYGWEIKILM
jgi:hypothetical protein